MSLFLELQQTHLLAQVYAKLCHLPLNTIALIWPIKNRQDRLWQRKLKSHSGESLMRFFPTSPSKWHQKERNSYTGYIYVGRPPLGCRGDVLGWGGWCPSSWQMTRCSMGHSESKLALLMRSCFRLQPLGWCRDLSSQPFHKGQTHGHDGRYGASCTILVVRIRIRVNLGAM